MTPEAHDARPVKLPDHRWEALEIEIDPRGRHAVISFRLEDLRSPHVQEAMRRECDILQDRLLLPRVVIDFGRVRHASSTVLGILLHFANELCRTGKTVVAACHVGDELARAFELLKADRVMMVCAGRSDALRVEAQPETARHWWWPFG